MLYRKPVNGIDFLPQGVLWRPSGEVEGENDLKSEMEGEGNVIKFSVTDNIAVVTIDRPRYLNALNTSAIAEFRRIIDQVDKDAGIRALIITGEGSKAFMVGSDINEFEGLSPYEMLKYNRAGRDLVSAIEEISKPSIAAINGYALGGGCELALACDFRIASSTATFGQTEINLGWIPGWGGIQRLSRIVGMARAKELVLTGDIIDAKRACEIGMVHKVVEPGELMDTSLSLARKMAEKAPVAIDIAKMVFRLSADCDMASGATLEALGVSLCFSTEDKCEGLASFFEKRAPRFQGR